MDMLRLVLGGSALTAELIRSSSFSQSCDSDFIGDAPPGARLLRCARNDSASLILEPARRHGHTAVPLEDSVDLCHVVRRDGPAERAEVFRHLGRFAKADQCGADDWVAQGPAQCELSQGLVVFRREALEIIDSLEVAGKLLGAEQRAEQVDIAEHAAARAPVALLELHAGVKGAAQ